MINFWGNGCLFGFSLGCVFLLFAFQVVSRWCQNFCRGIVHLLSGFEHCTVSYDFKAVPLVGKALRNIFCCTSGEPSIKDRKARFG